MPKPGAWLWRVYVTDTTGRWPYVLASSHDDASQVQRFARAKWPTAHAFQIDRLGWRARARLDDVDWYIPHDY